LKVENEEKMLDYQLLGQSPRILFEAQLRPVQGERFQPTGFADIGAAEYTRPDRNGTTGTQMLLVESAQSLANRLEKTCLDGDGPHICPELKGLPYVLARLNGATPDTILTSSLVEPHRIASPYFLRSTFADTLSTAMSYTAKGQLNWKKIYSAIFKYDANCLIHGVFLSLLDGGRVRVPRALSGFIEAEGVKPAISGGVKNSSVDSKGQIQVAEGKIEGGVYSNVPYSRV
jgi:CRISPR-associated protein Csb1